MNKTVIVTGAGGFLGSHLSEYYLNLGYSVIAIDNFCTGLQSNKAYLENLGREKIKFLEFDVCGAWPDLKKLAPAWMDSLEYIFHFASPASPPHYQRLGIETLWVNSLGLSKCLEIADANNSARVLFASTSEVYGDPSFSPQPESYWGNVNSFGERSCYDEAKRFGEALIFTHNKKYKTKHGLVRIFNTYGPRMNPNDGRVVINFIVQALKNETITVYGDGLQTRSFCYVDDLIRAISLYAKSNLTEPVNIGNNREFTMLELAQVVIQQLKSKSNLAHLPLPSDDPKQRKPDLTKANSLLNYQPSIALEDGVLKMAEWLKTTI